MSDDPATLVRVARGKDVIGEFYLSVVEQGIKAGTFQPTDWGWSAGMDDWANLPEALKSIRAHVGKKRLATTAQRAYLKRSGFTPWRGISNSEAHAVLNSLTDIYQIPPGSWLFEPSTDAQAEFLHNLGAPYSSTWTKGEACLAINQRLASMSPDELYPCISAEEWKEEPEEPDIIP